MTLFVSYAHDVRDTELVTILCTALLAAVPYVECRQRRPSIETYQALNSPTGWQARIYLKEPSLGEAIRLLLYECILSC